MYYTSSAAYLISSIDALAQSTHLRVRLVVDCLRELQDIQARAIENLDLVHTPLMYPSTFEMTATCIQHGYVSFALAGRREDESLLHHCAHPPSGRRWCPTGSAGLEPRPSGGPACLAMRREAHAAD